MNLFALLHALFKRSSDAIHTNSPNPPPYASDMKRPWTHTAYAGLFAFVGILTMTAIGVPFVEYHFGDKAMHTVSGKDVLAAQTIQTPLDGTIVFSIPAVFKKPVTFESDQIIDGDTVINGSITAPNIIYAVAQGKGIGVTTGQNPTITNTGVLSFQGQTGDVTLTAGDGISIDGTKIINTAQGSAQKIFGTVSVDGTTFTAGSNTDTLEFISGTGVTLTPDTTGKSVTIAASGGGGSGGVTSIAGTANQVLINGATTAQAGAVTLTLPQNIGTGSSPTFAGATLTGVGTGVVHSSSGVLSSSTVALGSEVSGTLPVANGGTGQTSFTSNGVLYGNGAGALQVTSSGSTGQVLGVDGTGTPVWTTISAGGSGSCTNCLSTNPSTTQTIQPTGNVTGLTVAQASSASPSADIFAITNSTGTVKFIQVDSNGNVILNNNDLQLGGNINMKTDDTNLANIVDTFVYDTSTDVDAGAWTNNGNAQAASWYNEPVAPTANCVLGLSTRCGTRPFPKRVIIVARTTAVYLYDAQNDTLWMSLNTGSGFALDNTTLSSVFALNGVVYVGTSSTGLVAFDFINDKISRFDYNAGSGGRAQFLGTLAQRNTNIGYEARQSWGQIAADKVNGVFARVINGKTYIALATLGGASVIDLSDQRVVRYIDN